MCGITGFLDLSNTSSAASALHLVRRMADTLQHRGPDDVGAWVDAAQGIAVGFRRLAIVDLSRAGHQPMQSPSGRHVIVFNGEIYNHQELRERLISEVGHCFRGTSDTEVLLAAIDFWGLRDALTAAVGMFALAVWDKSTRTLSLARDRMGEKPLYYALLGSTVVFGSELKALRKHPSFDAQIDRDALSLYLRHGYIPAPFSIYRGVRKLVPGCILSIPTGLHGALPEPTSYWSLQEAARRGQASPFQSSEVEACEQLDFLLRQSLNGQMVADVPLGAFLSGGIDSSLVVALMQRSNRRTRTFSIGFEESTYDEAPYAAAVAQHLGTEHTQMIVTSAEARAVIPGLPFIYDEPFADSSQIPTYLVARLAKEQVTVALSGDGGDELFQGYCRYRYNEAVWRRFRYLPVAIRKTLSGIVSGDCTANLDRASQRVLQFLMAGRSPRLPTNRIRRLAEILAEPGFEAQYRSSVSAWFRPDDIVIDGREPSTLFGEPRQWAELAEVGRQMQYLDTLTYLPDDILTKVDRATMAVSLEARVPLLDHRIVEFAWALPTSMLRRGGQAKWILRRILDRYVPTQLIDRPKMGFGIPLGEWLRGPLRDWAEDLLSVARLTASGFFRPDPIRQRWQQHLSGRADWHYALWNVIAFQAWHDSVSREQPLSMAA